MHKAIVFLIGFMTINAVAQSASERWQIERLTTETGTSVTALYSTADNQGVAVRCRNGELAVIVGFNRKLADRPPVEASYSFNGGQLFVQDWGLSKKGHLAFAPDPRWLARQLARNNSFYIEVLSPNGYPNQASFPLNGSGQAIAEVLSACPDGG